MTLVIRVWSEGGAVFKENKEMGRVVRGGYGMNPSAIRFVLLYIYVYI